MAGNYPDVPGPRLAYDRDGSIGFFDDSGSVALMSTAQLRTVNNESADNVGDSTTRIYGLIFPELRDIVGYFFMNESGGDEQVRGVQTSPDTTTGVDGTWTTQISGNAVQTFGFSGISPAYRTITPVTWSGIKAIRWTAGRAQDAWHFYGRIAAGQTPDRLRLWHPTLDQALDDQAVSPDGAYFDWGDVAQGTTFDRTFRIKNNSGSLTANTVIVNIESLTPLAIPDVLTLSKDGITFSSSISFTSIVPGAITAVCTLRRTTPVNATLSLAAMRLNAVASSWS